MYRQTVSVRPVQTFLSGNPQLRLRSDNVTQSGQACFLQGLPGPVFLCPVQVQRITAILDQFEFFTKSCHHFILVTTHFREFLFIILFLIPTKQYLS